MKITSINLRFGMTIFREAEEIRSRAVKVLEKIGFFYQGKHPDNEDFETKLFGRGWDMSYWSGRMSH